MLKRTLATILWFMAAWELGSAIDILGGVNSGLLAPAFSLVAASVVAIDPFHWFFPRPFEATARPSLSAAGQGHLS